MKYLVFYHKTGSIPSLPNFYRLSFIKLVFMLRKYVRFYIHLAFYEGTLFVLFEKVIILIILQYSV